LLRPTAIYVQAALDLLRAPGIDVHGFAHVTGDGFLNLPRLSERVGWSIDSPLPVPPVCELIAERASVTPEDMWETFNMGCGFCCIVPATQADSALALLKAGHPGAGVIGSVTDHAGVVALPSAGLAGRRGDGFARA
jgi:phosphoribosylformylglycinamidine cyclo-ligase